MLKSALSESNPRLRGRFVSLCRPNANLSQISIANSKIAAIESLMSTLQGERDDALRNAHIEAAKAKVAGTSDGGLQAALDATQEALKSEHAAKASLLAQVAALEGRLSEATARTVEADVQHGALIEFLKKTKEEEATSFGAVQHELLKTQLALAEAQRESATLRTVVELRDKAIELFSTREAELLQRESSAAALLHEERAHNTALETSVRGLTDERNALQEALQHECSSLESERSAASKLRVEVAELFSTRASLEDALARVCLHQRCS